MREGPFVRLCGGGYLVVGTFFCFDIVRYGIEPEAVVATYIFGSIAAFTLVRSSRKASQN